jgi:hypothetical protein
VRPERIRELEHLKQFLEIDKRIHALMRNMPDFCARPHCEEDTKLEVSAMSLPECTASKGRSWQVPTAPCTEIPVR